MNGEKLRGNYYYKEKLEYKGEFLYNKKWNGKDFDANGNIIYELKNGNGKVKKYNDYSDIFVEGEYLNGKRHGKAKIYRNNDILLFEGEYLNGHINGKCKEYYSDGILNFEGEYLNDKKWNGKGYDEFI